MRRTIVYATAATLMIGGVAGQRQVAAQAAGSVHDHSATATTTTTQTTKTASAGSSGMRAAADYQIGEAQKKLVALAEATPAEKFGWRPGEGVRSTGEVFMHVASANYFFPTFWGGKIPAGVDPQALEKDGGDKAKTVAALKQSFDSLRHSMDGLSDADLAKPIKIFGHDATVGAAVLIAVTHAHEHLGQSIAYARVNGIVPPWSAEQGQRGR